MRYAIQDKMPSDVKDWIAEQLQGEPDEGPKQRLEVRLTPTEYSEIVACSGAEGCSPQRWIINCVRASLPPQFTMEATKALWESTGQLRAIGRNLNQMANKLNEGVGDALSVKEIKGISDYIYGHTEAFPCFRTEA